MHISAFGLEDTLRSADLGIAELRVDHVIRRIEHQIVIHRIKESLALGPHVVRTRRNLGIVLCQSLDHEREYNAVTRLHRVDTAAVNAADNAICALDTSCRIRLDRLLEFWYLQRVCHRARIARNIPFAHGRLLHSGEDHPIHLKAVITLTMLLNDTHRAVQLDSTGLERKEVIVIDTQLRHHVQILAQHQTAVRIVRDRTQHREDQRAVHPENAILVNIPIQDHGHILAAHLDMVVMRYSPFVYIHTDGLAVRLDRPTILRRGGHAQRHGRQRHSQKSCSSHHFV